MAKRRAKGARQRRRRRGDLAPRSVPAGSVPFDMPGLRVVGEDDDEGDDDALPPIFRCGPCGDRIMHQHQDGGEMVVFCDRCGFMDRVRWPWRRGADGEA